MRSLAWGLGIYDLKTLLVAVLTLEVVTVVATAVPARRSPDLKPESHCQLENRDGQVTGGDR